MIFDYVIVGGGISGLYTYLELLKKTTNILLLEGSSRFGGRIYEYTENDVSFPAGAARFNKNHERVIKLLKRFHLLDFRKDRGISSNIDFVDSRNQFSLTFKNKTGFEYIKKVLRIVEKTKKVDILRNYTFQEYAKKYLQKDEVDFLLVASGYSGQLKHMNMYDAYYLFKNGIRDDVTFYSGYYQDLVENIVQELKINKCKMLLNTMVKSVEFNVDLGHYSVTINKKMIETKHIVYAIPKPDLLKMKLLKPIHIILDSSIGCKPLCRVYAKFDSKDIWFKNIKKTVTNNPLRYIIPMDRDKGTIMISYTDDAYCEYWRKMQNNQSKLKATIVDLVEKTFQKKINQPKEVWVFYWECGVGYWNKGVNSVQVADFLANPMENVYICGENYSLEQSWVEGALESCERVLRKI